MTDADNGTSVPRPIGVLAELTHRCPLACPYCSNPLQLDAVKDELAAEAWIDIFQQSGKLGVLQVHLSGGEPFSRRDLPEIVKGAADAGLYTNLITSGIGATRTRLEALSEAGLDHVQLSVQDADAVNGDRIANYAGGHGRKLDAARMVRELGLPLTLNAPVHRQNVDNLPALIAVAVDVGARRMEVAHIQYYGWGLKNRAALMPTRDQVRRSMEVVTEARTRLRGILEIDFVAPDYYARRPKPCMGGWGRGILNITPSGKVLPCHAAETIPGLAFANVRDAPLAQIWQSSPAFNAFRGTAWMLEPCASCEHREQDWGGCRCQALAITGSAGNTDPACAKSPRHADLLALADGDAGTVAPPQFHYRTATTTHRSEPT